MAVVTTFDPASLPYLSFFDFSAIIDWYFAASDALRKLFPCPEFPINVLIAPEVEEAALALGHVDHFPKTLDAAFELLGQVTAPTSSAARAAILSRVTIQKHLSASSLPSLVAAVVSYNRRFKMIAKFLKVDGRPAVNYFVQGLFGDLHHLVAVDAKLEGTDSLEDIQNKALAAATRLDSARQDGLLQGASARFPHQNPSSSISRTFPHSTARLPKPSHSSPTSYHAQPRAQLALAPLTVEEREHL